MDAYHHVHGVHNRTSHLTQLYSDAKKSALTNVQPTLSPQFSDLHRKYRIQRDRLIAWGLAWSDDGKGPDGNIDESVARAGLTETVDSVLRNIKEVTEEAERIRTASLPGAYNKDGVMLSTPAEFDEPRYEDLLRDLTTSIDTLYDLSDSRRALARGEHPKFEEGQANLYPIEKPTASGSLKRKLVPVSFASSEGTLFNPSFSKPPLPAYSGGPARIERSALQMPDEHPPPYEAMGVPSTTRLVAQLKRSQLSPEVQSSLGSSAEEVPVLVEYAEFDSTYWDTGVPPPLQRLESLASFLQPVRPESQTNLSLLGYFEDPAQPRIGLVYDLPYAIQNKLRSGMNPRPFVPMSLLKMVQKSNKTQPNTNEPSVPALEDRFRMALRLVEQLHLLHDRQIAHGNINSSSIIFTTTANETGTNRQEALRSPLWASFDIFSKCAVEGIRRPSALNVYRHPLDEPNDKKREFQADLQFDLYSLGLCLLEIGFWMPIGDVYKQKYSIQDFKLRVEKLWIPKLAAKCGTAYQQAVETCVRLSDNPKESKLTVEGVYGVLLQYLRRCALIDDVGTSTELIPVSELEAQLASKWLPSAAEQSLTPTQMLPTSPQPERPGELALGWEEKTTADGRTFYIDHNTRTTTWTDPRTTSASQVSSPHLSHSQSFPITAGLNPYASEPVSRSSAPPRSSSLQQPPQVRGFSPAPLKFHFTSAPSSRDFKRRITLIQQRWRERQALQKAAIQTGADSQPTSHSRTRNFDVKSESRVKRFEFPELALPPEILEHWQSTVCFQLQALVEKALRGSPESSSIRLRAYGESPETARPTFIVGCSSTAKVKNILKRHFKYDHGIYDVRVKKEDIRRCRKPRRERILESAHRSMAPMRDPDVEMAANPDYQMQPTCGASIGAYRDDEHLPPASFGGIVLVDGRPYGMSVHHMLEPEDDDEPEMTDDAMDDDASETSSLGGSDEDSLLSEDDDQSTIRPPSMHESDDGNLPMSDTFGDSPGINPGDFDEVAITQPALDDAIDLDLHVDESDSDSDSGIDEDHLLSYKFGQVYASSGLRRTAKTFEEGGFKSISQSLPQEIDWALFELLPPRTYPFNVVKGGSKFCARSNRRTGDAFPNNLLRASADLACVRVHCRGRTSGLGSGVISSTMELVKIHGRHTFSASWTVAGDFGVGGDSGAWVIANDDGRVCGHVLAAKKGRTYICPMDLLLEDIKLTLGANEVVLPTTVGVAAETGRAARRREEEQMMSEAIDRMRLVDPEAGGVKVPPSPMRPKKPRTEFYRTPESVQTAW